VLEHVFQDLHEEFGVDFPKQWAFEWQAVMDSTKSAYSEYPYHFTDGSYRQSGVSGQFSQRQDDVYRSAFLRAIAWGVNKRMPLGFANDLAAHTLTLNNDFANLKPIGRPSWLGALPEECCKDGTNFEALCKKLIEEGRRATGAVPISIKVPISPEVQKFGDLRVTAVIVSPDFRYERPALDHHGHKFWHLGESSSFNQSLSKDNASDYLIKGERGTYLPIAMNIWPIPLGFWHHDYFATGISLPMSYALPSPGSVCCRVDSLAVEVDGSTVSVWQVWHDHFSPLHAQGGSPRCGMVTTMLPETLSGAEKANGRKLGWVVQRRVWKSEKDYSELELNDESLFFFDET
jgi:hypothetical protein